ncbi:GPAM1-like protein [Mya arenaria]|uniref:GPAM1-like protein n=1 Tax=Mya arenaria TaxID=6604 RepID=A0ABY7G6N3_MYAAR|nr:GPAM1-like protein [Mya arenaria]
MALHCLQNSDAVPKRETWMTELPSDMGTKFGLGARQFRKGEAPEQDCSWTDNPGDKDKKKDKKKKKEVFVSEADKKAAKEIDKYNKKFRAKSLLEMHQKKIEKKKKKEKKKEKRERKKNKGKEKPKERLMFDRERDLKVNELDEAQRKSLIKRSQELGSRFKSGGTGTSFL